MELLPSEILFHICQQLDINDIDRLSQCSRYLYSFCQDKTLWIFFAKRDLKASQEFFLENYNLNPKERFHQIREYRRNGLQFLKNACVKGNLLCVQYLIEHGSFNKIYKNGFSVETSPLNEAIYYAAKYNQLSIIQYLLTNRETYYLSIPKRIVVEMGHIDIMDYFIKLWEQKPPPYSTVQEELNELITYAAGAGQLKMVDYLISKGANELNEALREATARDQLSIIIYLIEKGASDFEGSIFQAIKYDHLLIVQYLISTGIVHINEDIFNIAIKYNRIQIIRYLESLKER